MASWNSQETEHLLNEPEEELANDSKTNSQTDLKVSSNSNYNGCDFPEIRIPLPPGKLFHVFVSHSSDDAVEVRKLVVDLESRYDIKCLLADRDFKAGELITDNIKYGMEKSMKILFVLTPSFFAREYCQYEQHIAFEMYIANRQFCLIPLVFKPLPFDQPLPSDFINLTYIDAQKETDLPARIYAALRYNGKLCLWCLAPFYLLLFVSTAI